jgi:hypothetical protein
MRLMNENGRDTTNLGHGRLEIRLSVLNEWGTLCASAFRKVSEKVFYFIIFVCVYLFYKSQPSKSFRKIAQL